MCGEPGGVGCEGAAVVGIGEEAGDGECERVGGEEREGEERQPG